MRDGTKTPSLPVLLLADSMYTPLHLSPTDVWHVSTVTWSAANVSRNALIGSFVFLNDEAAIRKSNSRHLLPTELLDVGSDSNIWTIF